MVAGRTQRASSGSLSLMASSSDHEGMDVMSGSSDDECEEMGICFFEDAPHASAARGGLEDAFTWPVRIIGVLSRALGQRRLRRSLMAQQSSLSTHFSAVGCAETAASMLSQAMTVWQLGSVTMVESTEINKGCRNILLRKQPWACAFTNMKDLLFPEQRSMAACRSTGRLCSSPIRRMEGAVLAMAGARSARA